MMKKTIFILTALAALACTAISCRKEFAEMQQGATGFTVTATIAGGGTAENGTKVSATDDDSSLALKWEQGDKLIGFDNHNNTYGFEVTSVDGGKATLTRIEDGDEDERGTATTDPADGTTMYMLYVPGKTVENLTLNSPNDILNYDLSEQDEDALPVSMTAKGTVTDGKLDLTFEVQTAIIGIKSPTMENDATTSIILSSTAALNTKVTFSLDNNGDLKATYGSGDAGTVTKAVNFTSTNPGTNTFIVVCPVTSADLTFTSNKGEAFSKENKTVDAGKYYYMTPTFESSAREITVSFGTETANFFGSGGSLKFNTSKEIRVYDSEANHEDIEVPEESTSVKIKTNLKGNLTLAYPADLASDGVIAMTVPASQNSTTAPGASDLRAMATIGEDATEAVLENWTPIFKITLPALSTITRLEIRSLPAVENQVGRTGEKADINTNGTDKSIVTISPASGNLSSGGSYYVFLKGGVKLSDLAFDAVTGDYTGSMAGIPNKDIIERNAVYATANTPPTTACYEIPATNFHPYVKIENAKWAEMNIGANSKDAYGLYFAWGEIVGHVAANKPGSYSYSPSSGKVANAFQNGFSSFVYSDSRYSKCSWDASKGFASTYCNTPYYDSGNNSWWKYNGTDEKTTLDLMDDAAFYNWGGPWGIPTPDDFDEINTNNTTSGDSRWYSTGNGSTESATLTKYGFKFTTSNVTLYFPAAGRGNGLDAENRYYNSATANTAPKINCWSNTLPSDNVLRPYHLMAYRISTGTKVSITPKYNNIDSRHLGFSIRPVSTY